MSTCPNGHQSNTDDWCEVCGHRMTPPDLAAPSAPSTPYGSSSTPYGSQDEEQYGRQGQRYQPAYDPAGYGSGYEPGPGQTHSSTPATEPCPICRTPREGMSQYCEECRYNFVTHAGTQFVQPSPPAPPPFQPSPPAPPPFQPPFQRYEQEHSSPSQMNRPAEPLAPDAVTTGAGDFPLFPPRAQDPHHPHAGPGTGTWTAVVAADRDYFTAMMARSGPDGQGLFFPQYSPEHRLPLAGGQITIGRRRHSTGETPDIDLSVAPEDPGASHKHALLVEQPDGRWAVIDQDSTNGTTINGAEEPIDPFVPVPLREGDRVHVGAWTTITIVRG